MYYQSLTYIFLFILFSLKSPGSPSSEFRTNCFPYSNFNVSFNSTVQSGLSKNDFDLVINKIEETYSPIFTNLGAKLKINRRWEDNSVDASAMRFNNTWVINMYGGMARQPKMTVDTMTMIGCHEIGHHVGGFPKIAWASGEGQSDYYGALKCLRKVWSNDNNVSIVAKLSVPPLINQKCVSQFKAENDVALCLRIALAGQSLTQLLADLHREKPPRFETPSAIVASKIENGAIPLQCRLDTMYAASICNVDPTSDVSETDPNQGVCTKNLGISTGARPQCWYKDPY